MRAGAPRIGWCGLALLAFATAARAQDANGGAIKIDAALDLPSMYYFRGIRQEGDPRLTLWPSADATVTLRSDPTSRVAVRVGVWNSLHTGTSGTGGPEQKLQYEQDFSVALVADIGQLIRVEPSFVAYTSPNNSFDTIEEFTARISAIDRWQPYVLLAFELSDDGQRDEGSKKGSYVEIGAEPAWKLPVARATLAVPVRAGFSLNNYYELLSQDFRFHDNRFGFAQAGGRVTVPLTRSATRFGAWHVHAGLDALRLGTTTQALNKGKRSAVVVTGGLDMVY